MQIKENHTSKEVISLINLLLAQFLSAFTFSVKVNVNQNQQKAAVSEAGNAFLKKAAAHYIMLTLILD